MLKNLVERQHALQRRELIMIAAPAILLALGALWLAYQFVEPAPPRTILMSTGSSKGAYHLYGQKYAEILARDGIKLELKTSNGSKENAVRLMDPKSGVKVALVQGGAVTAKEAPGLLSLGRVYQQPLWVFYRSETEKSRLTEFRGQRLALGPEGSGTRALMLQILAYTNINDKEAAFFALENDEAATKLLAGELDAVFIATGADSPVVKRLITADGIRLLSLEQAEAYTRIFPQLGKVTLPQGLVDLDKNVPPKDAVLLAPQASLLIRQELHPAIVGLLVRAAQEAHSPGGLFQRTGEFPQAVDPEIPMSEDAQRVYSSGRTFLQRHLPFWLATFIERMLVMILPVATILLPLVKIVPWIYQWRIRNRILYWYGQLKRLERRLGEDGSTGARMTYKADVARIEQAVSVIPVPLNYSDQLYQLKSAIELVRQRIAGRA